MNNYQKLFKQEIASLKDRPSLLLHVCCGPCSVYPLKLLSRYFKITIYYANSNIYPYEEYTKRLNELERYRKMLNNDIEIVIGSYDSDYQKYLLPFKDQKEGLERCALCYMLRMKEAFAYADKNAYDYFTTVMTISNHKNADYINYIGTKLSEVYKHTRFLYADLKKDGGIDKNRQLNAKLDLYHQNYCGCIYSKHLAKQV